MADACWIMFMPSLAPGVQVSTLTYCNFHRTVGVKCADPSFSKAILYFKSAP